MFLLTAISLGFLGSFHCIGMCGPIALALPVNRTSTFSAVIGTLIYNLGRITTYAVLGLFFGLLGQGFVIAGWQSSLSIALGVLILVLLIFPRLFKGYTNFGFVYQFVAKLKEQLRKLFHVSSLPSLFSIGLLNGLLPCGLVYMGVAGAVATGDVIQGALFMAAFGLGTLPAMLVLSVAKGYIGVSVREKMRKAVPVFVAGMAILLILRGMNLGIPYLSPKMQTNNGVVCHHCCKK